MRVLNPVLPSLPRSSSLLRESALSIAALFALISIAFASTPVLVVKSPSNGASAQSPVHFQATATSSSCSKGISAVGVYTAPGVLAYSIYGSTLNTYITLNPGSYNTVVQTWDNCGGVAKTPISLKVTGAVKPASFLYATISNYDYGNTVNEVMGFQVLSNGSLASTGQAPVKANVFPNSSAANKTGNYLYVGDMVSGDVFAYKIQLNNGYITPVPGSPFPVNRSVTAVAVHPTGKFVYATRDENAAGDGVEVFAVQSNGVLTQIPGSPYATETGPQALVVDPSGKYLYVGDGAGYIEAFTIDQTSGALTPLPGSPYKITTTKPACGPFPTDLVDCAGKRLYSANAFDDSISGYNIEPTTGSLSLIKGSPFPDEGGCSSGGGLPLAFDPESLAIDSTGKFLYGGNGDSEEIAIYAIEFNGALRFIKYTPNTSACPGQIRTDIKGNYLYANACSNTGNVGITEFSIDHSTGALTPLPTSPYVLPWGPTSFAAAP
jgi:6-phosphogluconolactonase (cycloisomerase 2 family)